MHTHTHKDYIHLHTHIHIVQVHHTYICADQLCNVLNRLIAA